MPKYQNELNKLNKELINGYNIRLNNYNEGVETMKTINSIIQKASRLRGKIVFYLFLIIIVITLFLFFSWGQISKYDKLLSHSNQNE